MKIEEYNEYELEVKVFEFILIFTAILYLFIVMVFFNLIPKFTFNLLFFTIKNPILSIKENSLLFLIFLISFLLVKMLLFLTFKSKEFIMKNKVKFFIEIFFTFLAILIVNIIEIIYSTSKYSKYIINLYIMRRNINDAYSLLLLFFFKYTFDFAIIVAEFIFLVGFINLLLIKDIKDIEQFNIKERRCKEAESNHYDCGI